MTRWTCAFCGWADESSIFPDCCMRPMMPCIEISDEPAPRETEKTGFRDVSDFDRWADDAIESFDAEMDAAAGQPGDVIRFWQRGGKLSAHQQLVLDQALAANRVDQMQHVFRQAAA